MCVCVAALQKSESDVRAMKKQAENLTVEYDRLLEEHAKLQVGNPGMRMHLRPLVPPPSSVVDVVHTQKAISDTLSSPVRW